MYWEIEHNFEIASTDDSSRAQKKRRGRSAANSTVGADSCMMAVPRVKYEPDDGSAGGHNEQ